jgi:hypothetical protein
MRPLANALRETIRCRLSMSGSPLSAGVSPACDLSVERPISLRKGFPPSQTLARSCRNRFLLLRWSGIDSRMCAPRGPPATATRHSATGGAGYRRMPSRCRRGDRASPSPDRAEPSNDGPHALPLSATAAPGGDPTGQRPVLRAEQERSDTIGVDVMAILGGVGSRKPVNREDAAVTTAPPTTPAPPPAPKTAQRPAGYRSFAGSVRRICVAAIRKARSLLPGAGSRPPKT